MPADLVAIKAAMAGFIRLPTPLPSWGTFQETPNLALPGLPPPPRDFGLSSGPAASSVSQQDSVPDP